MLILGPVAICADGLLIQKLDGGSHGLAESLSSLQLCQHQLMAVFYFCSTRGRQYFEQTVKWPAFGEAKQIIQVPLGYLRVIGTPW